MNENKKKFMGTADFDRITPKVTYVLELEHDKFYVGSTYDFNRRLGEHIMGIYGSKFCRLYKPVRIVGVYKGDCEKEKTLQFMHIKGYQNVRGSDWWKPLNIEIPAELEEYKASILFKETQRYSNQKRKNMVKKPSDGVLLQKKTSPSYRNNTATLQSLRDSHNKRLKLSASSS